MLANMAWCGWLNAFPLPNYEEPQLTTETNSVTGASKPALRLDGEIEQSRTPPETTMDWIVHRDTKGSVAE